MMCPRDAGRICHFYNRYHRKTSYKKNDMVKRFWQNNNRVFSPSIPRYCPVYPPLVWSSLAKNEIQVTSEQLYDDLDFTREDGENFYYARLSHFPFKWLFRLPAQFEDNIIWTKNICSNPYLEFVVKYASPSPSDFPPSFLHIGVSFEECTAFQPLKCELRALKCMVAYNSLHVNIENDKSELPQ